LAWTGVGFVKLCFARLFFSAAERGRSVKLFIFNFVVLRRKTGEPTTNHKRLGVRGLRINFQSL
jgi:hypothetical protein